jgi:hypothetical protein
MTTFSISPLRTDKRRQTEVQPTDDDQGDIPLEDVQDIMENFLNVRSNAQLDPFSHISGVYDSYISNKERIRTKLENALETMDQDRADVVNRKHRFFKITNTPHSKNYDLWNMRI